MNYFKNTRGDALMMIVGIVALVALGGAGYFAYQHHQDAATNAVVEDVDTDTSDLGTDINQANNLSPDQPVPDAQ